MKLGFDIDDTLNNARYVGIDIFNKVLKKELSYEEVDAMPTISIHKVFNLDDEARKNVWKENVLKIYGGASPLRHIVEILNDLKNKGHEIFFVTARSNNEDIVNLTINWLITNGFPFDEQHFFIGMKDNEKIKIIREQGIDLFFDDKPSVIDNFIDEGFSDFIIKDQCYNRHYNQRRIRNWEEVYTYIK